MDLSLSTRIEGGRTVVEVGGEIDVYTRSQLRDALTAVIDGGQYHLVVDLERVTFLDSSGLGVLIGAHEKVRPHDGTLALICTQERLLKIFRITQLNKVFEIHADLDSAI